MSWEASTWALRVPVGGNLKVVLIGLGSHAHADGTHAFPSIDTLATYCHCDRRTVQRNLRKLEEDGWIAVESRRGTEGQTSYSLAMEAPAEGGGGISPPRAAPASRGGGTDAAQTVHNAKGGGEAREHAPLPEDFPDDLLPHLRAVYRVLRDLARRHASKDVTPLQLANVVMARPRKPLVTAAHDFAAWADGQAQRRKDVVSGYRNWLEKCNDLAATEALPGEAPAPRATPNVTPLRPPRSAEERRMERQARRMAIARGEVAPQTAESVALLGGGA